MHDRALYMEFRMVKALIRNDDLSQTTALTSPTVRCVMASVRSSPLTHTLISLTQFIVYDDSIS